MKNLNPFRSRRPLVAVVRLAGVISSGGRAGTSLSDESTSSLLERAFSKGRPSAVALQINSPGGSPVQSSLIGARVRRLSEEKGVPVYAFVEDVAASGGYWLASSADEIWADDSSMLGSIGVISAGFGLQDLISRYGVERRVHTAGKSKSLLDPFRPEKPEDIARLETWLEQIHQAFIRQVNARRKDRLQGDQDLFSGDIWIGRDAVEVGLADGIGHLVPTMKDKLGEKLRFKVYGPKRGLLHGFGRQLAGGSMAAVEERLAYSRFGL